MRACGGNARSIACCAQGGWVGGWVRRAPARRRGEGLGRTAHGGGWVVGRDGRGLAGAEPHRTRGAGRRACCEARARAAMQSDLEIARGATLLPLEEVAAKVGLTAAELAPRAEGVAKLRWSALKERMIDCGGGCGTRLAARRCALPRAVRRRAPPRFGVCAWTADEGREGAMRVRARRRATSLTRDRHTVCGSPRAPRAPRAVAAASAARWSS